MDVPQMTDTYTYVIDIDGTICNTTGMDYENSIPIPERIEQINILYNLGHKIIFLTARGMGRNGNSYELATNQFFDLTSSQLKKWGCKYHELHLSKPAGDFYIDDKAVKDSDFFDQL
jgi:histidinol phosphatase-like enzyme